jgi:sortase A
MGFAKVAGVVGRLMVGAGVVLLLFVAYQLWGTGLQTRAAQNELRGTIETQLAEADEVPGDAERQALAEAALAAAEPGDPVALLRIPTIDIDYVVVQGVDLVSLKDGPGHFPETPMPGQPGNAAIAGHRATFDAPFNRLDELVPGDTVLVATLQGQFTYTVTGHPNPADPQGPELGYHIVSPTALEILDDAGDNRLTLMGCHPRYGATERIVVTAELTDTAALPTPPVVETAGLGGELLTGDPGSWAAVLGWSAVVVALVAAVMVLRRWVNRWIVYALSVPVFGVVLFQAFEAVAALSPVAY